jgi:osmoprotectant transport system permease protein
MYELYLYIINNINNMLTLLWQHFYLFFISILIALVVGLLLSILASRDGKEGINTLLISITGACQAVPSIAVIAFAFIFVGIGAAPAIIALAVYSLVPIVFNACSGFASIDPNIIEVAKGMGYTESKIITKIKIPIASPVIMAGVRSAATINIGTAAIASVIGAGGFGDLIFIGLKLNRAEILLTGAILTALLAIVVDILLYLLESKLVPVGIQLTKKKEKI